MDMNMSKITLLNSLDDVGFSKLVKFYTGCNYILQKVKPVATENTWLITKIQPNLCLIPHLYLVIFTDPSSVSLPSSWGLRKDLKSMNQPFWISRINTVNDVKCQYIQAVWCNSNENIINPEFCISCAGCTERMTTPLPCSVWSYNTRGTVHKRHMFVLSNRIKCIHSWIMNYFL